VSQDDKKHHNGRRSHMLHLLAVNGCEEVVSVVKKYHGLWWAVKG
jgi:hypothetical protein